MAVEPRTVRSALCATGSGPIGRRKLLRALIRERFGTVEALEREAHTRPGPPVTAEIRERRRILLQM
jgi:hypothetical protein